MSASPERSTRGTTSTAEQLVLRSLDPAELAAIDEARRLAEIAIREISREPMSPEMLELMLAAAELGMDDVASSSRKTYRSYWDGYSAFCRKIGRLEYDPVTLVMHVMDRIGHRETLATLQSRVASIKRYCNEYKQLDPTDHVAFRKWWKAAKKRLQKSYIARRVEPATTETFPRLLQAIRGSERIVRRDRAMVLLGYALGRRGAELASIKIELISRREEGWIFTFIVGKTLKKPEYVGVPRFADDDDCPIGALEALIEAENIRTGHVFLSMNPLAKTKAATEPRPMTREDIGRRMQTIAARAGLSGFWGSHSFRRGLVTDSEHEKVPRSRTRINTGWTSDAMFGVYVDHRDLIAASPLHEIYAAKQRRAKSSVAK